MKGITRSTYLRFAAGSFLALTIVCSSFSAVGYAMVVRGAEQRGADRAAALVGEPLQQIVREAGVSEPFSGEERARLDGVVWPLANGSLEAVRITAADGTVLYESGTALPPGAGAGWSRVAAGDAEIFVSRVPGEGYFLEIGEDAASVDALSGQAQMLLFVIVPLFGFLAWLLLQGALWAGIRTLTKVYGRLAQLYEIGVELRSSVDLLDVLSELSERAVALAGGTHGLVALHEPDKSEVVLRATFDKSTGEVALHQRPIDEWFIRRCVATGEVVAGTNASGGYGHVFGPDHAIPREASVLCVPMSIREGVVGAIAILRSDGRSFTGEDAQLASQLASQAVSAVEQAILFAKVRADATKLEESYDSTLRALMAALDAKDEVTEGRPDRVSMLTVELARLLGMPEENMVHLERGALLHDVGKIGVPDAILRKPEALNEREWEAVRKHPLMAGLMVSKIGFLEPALPILLYHHERYDGSGYPFGLTGDTIPIEARIFSVVDAYDAMTSDRPWRKAMSHLDAIAEVRANSGTQFDPDVVAAFQHLIATHPEMREHAGRRVLGTHDIEDAMPGSEHVA